MRKISVLLLAALFSVACAADAVQPTTDAGGESPRSVAQKVAADYAKVSTDDVQIISVESVDFSNSSLGCPQPDMAYLAVITPGYKVLAQAGGKQLDVRVAGKRGFVCESPAMVMPKR